MRVVAVKDAAVVREVVGKVAGEPGKGGDVREVEQLDPGLLGEPRGVGVGPRDVGGGGARKQEPVRREECVCVCVCVCV